MTQNVRLQLKKLVSENEIKRDAKPRPIEQFACSTKTERSIEAERGDKIIKEKLRHRVV